MFVKPQKIARKKKPSLMKALAKEFWGTILVAVILKIIYDLANFINPQLLE